MKAERKHELEHNELDDLLAKSVLFLRENAIFLAVAAGVLILAVVLYFTMFARQPINADAGLWDDYILALSDADAEKELQSFVDKEEKDGKASQLPVLWARLSLGNMELAAGIRDLFENREAALESLADAEKHFLEIEKHATRNVELRDRALIGLAEVYESQSKPEEALKYFAMVAKSSPESPQGKIAARGERRLSQESNREFLAWFAQQKPIKRPSSTPSLDFNDPPESPNFSLPPLPGSNDKPITPGLKIPSKLPDEAPEPGTDPEPTEKEPPAKGPTDTDPTDTEPGDKASTEEQPE